MPSPLRYTETLLVRLPPGTRQRIAGLRRSGELLAETQRRVVLAGIAALEPEGANTVQEPPRAPAKRGER